MQKRGQCRRSPPQRPRQYRMPNETARMMRGTTDLMMAGGTLIIGAGALGLVSGVSKSLNP